MNVVRKSWQSACYEIFCIHFVSVSMALEKSGAKWSIQNAGTYAQFIKICSLDFDVFCVEVEISAGGKTKRFQKLKASYSKSHDYLHRERERERPTNQLLSLSQTAWS